MPGSANAIPKSNPARPTSFADITGLIAALPPLPAAPDDFTTALHADPALGEKRAALLWLGHGQRRFPPQLGQVGFALYLGQHARSPAKPDAKPNARPHDTPHRCMATDWDALLAPWQDRSAPALQRLSADAQIDFDLYELAGAPIGDSTLGPALGEATAAHAMAYGMLAVKPDLDLLVLSTAADAPTGAMASARDVVAALLKRESTSPAIETNRATLTDPLTILATLGGHESCAILGAILAARLAGYPVLIEGLPALAAALVLAQLAGRDAAALLGHVRATAIPADLQPVFRDKLLTLPGLEVPAASGDGLQAAALLPQLRALA